MLYNLFPFHCQNCLPTGRLWRQRGSLYTSELALQNGRDGHPNPGRFFEACSTISSHFIAKIVSQLGVCGGRGALFILPSLPFKMDATVIQIPAGSLRHALQSLPISLPKLSPNWASVAAEGLSLYFRACPSKWPRRSSRYSQALYVTFCTAAIMRCTLGSTAASSFEL